MLIKLGILASPKFQASYKKLIEMKCLPLATSFKLRRISREIAEQVASYKEYLKEAADKYALRDENGKAKIQYIEYLGQNCVIIDNAEDYNKHIEDLNTLEVEIPEISFHELGSLDGLTTEDLVLLEFITN